MPTALARLSNGRAALITFKEQSRAEQSRAEQSRAEQSSLRYERPIKGE